MPNALQIIGPDSDNPLAQAPSWADAYGSVTGTVSSGVDALGQWLAVQRAKSAQMGLWNDQTGLPTGKGLVSAAQQTGNALLMGTTAPGIRAFHGSPYDFERFDTSKIGTGEGAQAYGHGLYMAGAEDTARSYRENLSNPELVVDGKKVGEIGALGTDPIANAAHALATSPSPAAAKEAVRQSMTMQQQGNYGYSQATGNAVLKAIDDMAGANVEIRPGGKMYEVNIGADPEQFLHWDKPLSEQSPHVQKALSDFVEKEAAYKARYPNSPMGDPLGSNIYQSSQLVPGDYRDAAAAAQELQKRGIPGIRYLDQGSRGAGEGTHNYVVFDANTIDILRKYGIAGLGLGLSSAAATNGSQQQPPMAQ